MDKLSTNLKLWIEGEQESLPCAVETLADFEGLGGQSPKHLQEHRG